MTYTCSLVLVLSLFCIVRCEPLWDSFLPPSEPPSDQYGEYGLYGGDGGDGGYGGYSQGPSYSRSQDEHTLGAGAFSKKQHQREDYTGGSINGPYPLPYPYPELPPPPPSPQQECRPCNPWGSSPYPTPGEGYPLPYPHPRPGPVIPIPL